MQRTCAARLRQMRLGLALGVATLAACPFTSFAQNYPTKPIRLIVRAPPGGADDFHARVVGQKLTDVLKQQVVIDYRSGAGGLLAWEHVANAPADGYTVLLAASGLGAMKSLRPDASIDPWRDFAWVSQIANFALLLITHPALPAKNAKELIALARAKPGQLAYGNSGMGATPHLAAEYFKHLAKVNIIGVPYKGSAPMMVDLIAGQVQLGFSVMASPIPYVKAGKLRALGVTGPTRSALLPDVPTIAESGVPGYSFTSFYALLLPAKTPRDIVTTLAAATAKAVAMPDYRERLLNAGTEAAANTPEQMLKLAKEAGAQIDEIVRVAGIKGE